MSKQYFLVVDTETTIDDTVADFAAVVIDRKGVIQTRMAVLVRGHYDTRDLFYIPNTNNGWSKSHAESKRVMYDSMLESGARIMASVSAINNWLNKALGKYNPTLTAYNLSFDVEKSRNTGIDLDIFNSRFCLWQAAVGNICNRKSFRQFCLDNHRFNKPTDKGNMTFQTNAEVVAGYLAGVMNAEPHTALEDILDFEIPILTHIVKKHNWKTKIIPYNYRNHQVRDNFKAV